MFKPAVKEKLKARIAIEGPSGSGKSFTALLLARGLVGPEGKVAMLDTEQESGKLYADLTTFDHASLEAPYTPERYIAVIQEAEKAGYDCLIIDSMSHEWIGAGGILEIHDAMPGNSYTNWAKVTPRHNKFIDAILKSKMHIIATMRSKQSYALETNEKGKQEPKKLGLAPQQRDGMEYEFTAVLKMDVTHLAEGDKDRTGLFPIGEWFKPVVEHGEKLAAWLNSGVDALPKESKPAPEKMYGTPRTLQWYKDDARRNADKLEALTAWYKDLEAEIKALKPADNKALMAHLGDLKKKLQKPATIHCAEGNKEVDPEDCKVSECAKTCEAYKQFTK